MKVTNIVVGDKALKYKLLGLAKKYEQHDDVVVGFTMNYAVYVHERNLNYNNNKQWKYLETAYKMVAPDIRKMVGTILKAGGTMTRGLLIAGLRIQREAQKIVPIDTGALRASAYTAREKHEVTARLAAKGRAWNKTAQADWMRD